MTQQIIAKNGMKTFTTIWFGQLVSSIGSGLTQFALGVWVYEQTKSVTLFGLILLFSTLPGILLFPITGALVDRWDRRHILIVSDSVAALATLIVVGLLWQESLAVWHIYVVTAVISTAQSLQWPAFGASVTLLVPPDRLGRAGGMMQLNEAATGIVAPLLAGFLMAQSSIHIVVLIDMITFVIAALTVSIVQIPSPVKTAEPDKKRPSLFLEAGEGWRYIKARPGLVALLLFFAARNFLESIARALFTPLLLSVATTVTLGTVMAAGSVGMLVGSTVISGWGGPKRRVLGVLGFSVLYGIFIAAFGLSRTIPVFIVATFGTLFMVPLVNATNQALWQSKVSPELQGRVFSIRYMIAWSTIPLALALAGPLADGVFKPLFVEGGLLSQTIVATVLGASPVGGIRLLYVTAGLLIVVAAVAGLLYPRLRLLEDELPTVTIAQPQPAQETAEPDLKDAQAQLEGAAGGAD